MPRSLLGGCAAAVSLCYDFEKMNRRLDEPFPAKQEAIKIEGFAEEGSTFGDCRCYPFKLNGMQAAVVRPERSRYPPELI